jgi:TolB protein
MLSNGAIRRLTQSPGIDNNPAWSPDGSQIVFRSDRTRFTALWLMNADGSNEHILTPKQFNGGVDPDWQPRPREHG